MRTRLSRLGRRIATHPAGPTVLAVLLAMLAIPFVAVTLNAYDTRPAYDDVRLHPLALGRWTGAAGACLISALVAGTLGGVLMRWRKDAEFFALAVAWVVAIAALPLVPAALGQTVGFERFCFDACNIGIKASDPTSGASVATWFFLGPIVEVPSFLTLIVGFVVWQLILSQPTASGAG